MAKLSLVFPTYTIDNALEDLEVECISTFKGKCDEIIITEDGGLPSARLLSIADRYIFNRIRRGFTTNVNVGWTLANGDYVGIVNSDISFVNGDLGLLCVPGRVTAPGDFPVVPGHFFVVPKEIKEQYGMLDESMAMWWSDADYGRRVWYIYDPVPEVEILHYGGSTHKKEPGLHGEFYGRDGEAYNKIWADKTEAVLSKEDQANFDRIQKVARQARKQKRMKEIEHELEATGIGRDNIPREVRENS